MKARGWRVFATARKAQDIARLRDEVGVESLYLDYAEPRSIDEAVEQVLKKPTANSVRSSTMEPMASLAPSKT
jgi:NADP-dependent 3-hydroxy acid dehydrogenase YdfG